MLSSSPLEIFYDNGGLRRHNDQGILVEQLSFPPNVSKLAAIVLRTQVFEDNQSKALRLQFVKEQPTALA